MPYALERAADYILQNSAKADEVRAANGRRWADDSRLGEQYAELDADAADFLEDGFNGALLRLAVVEDHLCGIANLIKEGGRVFPQYAVARSAAETAALAWWFLDPALPAIRRARRGFQDRRASLLDQRGLPVPGLDVQAEARRREVEAQASRAGVGSHRDDRFPRPTPLLEQMWRLPDHPKLGEVLYGLLSGFGHGSLYALTSMMGDEIEGGRNGRLSVRQLGTNAQQEALMLMMASTPYMKAAQRLVDVAGWQAEGWMAHLMWTNREIINVSGV